MVVCMDVRYSRFMCKVGGNVAVGSYMLCTLQSISTLYSRSSHIMYVNEIGDGVW